jgi:integration host factor subunit beta
MIRSELVQLLSESHPGLTARELDLIVTTFFDEIVAQLAKGGRIELRGFGIFTTRERDARLGRNPRTGESVPVNGKRVPFFKPGKEMRSRLKA